MFSTFTAVFEVLDEIEEELLNGVDTTKREQIVEMLVSLRNTMDKCVKYWLQFEDRMKSLQEQYGLELPDNLPENFFDGLTYLDETLNGAFPWLSFAEKEKQTKTQLKETALPETNLFEQLNEETAITSFRRGLGFWDLAMLEEAIKEFQRVIQYEPNFLIGHLFMGLACTQKGEFDRAIKELRLVLALSGEPFLRALAYNTLGSLYAAQEKYAVALDNFKKASLEKEDLEETYFNQGATLYNMKEYEACLEAFLKVLETNPGDWETLFYLGKASGYLQRWDEALNYLEKAYNLNPRDPLITFELGIACRCMGRSNKAAAYFYATQKLIMQEEKEG